MGLRECGCNSYPYKCNIRYILFPNWNISHSCCYFIFVVSVLGTHCFCCSSLLKFSYFYHRNYIYYLISKLSTILIDSNTYPNFLVYVQNRCHPCHCRLIPCRYASLWVEGTGTPLRRYHSSLSTFFVRVF